MEEPTEHVPPEALSSLKKASERKRQIPSYPQSSPGFRSEVRDKFNTGVTCPRLTRRAVTNRGEMPPSHLRGPSSPLTSPHLLRPPNPPLRNADTCGQEAASCQPFRGDTLQKAKS